MLPGLLVAVAIAFAIWLLVIGIFMLLGRRDQAGEFAAFIPNLVVLFKGLLGDDRVPKSSRLWVGFAIAWCVSPIDLIPEFVPIAGPVDDAIVAALVLRHVLRRTDRSLLEAYWRGSGSTLDTIIGVNRRPLG